LTNKVGTQKILEKLQEFSSSESPRLPENMDYSELQVSFNDRDDDEEEGFRMGRAQGEDQIYSSPTSEPLFIMRNNNQEVEDL